MNQLVPRLLAGVATAISLHGWMQVGALAQTYSATSLESRCDRPAAELEDPDRPADIPGVPLDAIDESAAIKACTAAAESSPRNARVLFELGRAFQAANDEAQSRLWLERGAANGSMRATYYLGVLHEQGTHKDYALARVWYEKAIAAGSVDASRRLAVLLEKGLGGPPDLVRARNLYETAAGNGDTLAMLLLGYMLQTGKGGTVDFAAARSWYRKAADVGDPGAMYFLAASYESDAGGREYTEARRWYEKAANAGNVSSLVRLGDFYAQGLGVSRDSATAQRFYAVAANAGNKIAQKKLDMLQSTPEKRTRE